MKAMDSDVDLLGPARGGNQAAFAELVRRHQAHVRAYLGGYIRHAEVVDDLAQETFLSAYCDLQSYDPRIASFRIWLLGIARHRGLMYLREERQRQAHIGPSLQSVLGRCLAHQAESEPSDPADQEIRIRTLRACLEQLPSFSAELVSEYYLKSRTTAEIAGRSGKSEAAVWKALSRIRQALRGCLEAGVSTLRGQA